MHEEEEQKERIALTCHIDGCENIANSENWVGTRGLTPVRFYYCDKHYQPVRVLYQEEPREIKPWQDPWGRS